MTPKIPIHHHPFTQKLYICVCSSVLSAHEVQVIYLSDFVHNIYLGPHVVQNTSIYTCIYALHILSRDMSLIIIYDWKRTSSVYAPIRHGRHNGSANKSLTWPPHISPVTAAQARAKIPRFSRSLRVQYYRASLMFRPTLWFTAWNTKCVLNLCK